MSEPAATSTAQSASAKEIRTRVTAENRYPVYDLNSSLTVAKAVKEQGGDACTVEQLGAFLSYKNTNGGGFVARIAATKLFGLVISDRGTYKITPRAEAALWPVSPAARLQALRDAFLGVPIYKQIYERFRGTQLPEEFGMKSLLRTQFQVPPGDRAALAYRVLMDSAEVAGFFTANQGRRTHLIEPVI